MDMQRLTTMDQGHQVAQLRQLLHYLETKTTAMADSEYRNPVTDYTCRAQLAAERKTLFRGHPLLMGLGSEIPEPGDFLTDDFSGVPVLVVRGEDGVVRGFLNVCRHRGSRVAQGRGNRRRFVCPYHGWTYGSDGQLLRIPHDEGFPGVSPACNSLTPVPVVEKYGLVWAMTSPGAEFDIDETLEGAEGDLATFDLGRYSLYETRVLEQKMNWKLVIDTFLETYHIRVLHPETLDWLIHSNVGTFEALGRNSRSIYVRRSVEELRSVPESDWDLVHHAAIVYVLFPNTVFIMQQDHLETWRIYPVGDDPDRARMYVQLYTPEPALTESAKRHWERNMDLLMSIVLEEDFPNGENIQRSFYSGAQEHVTYGRNEPALGHYHESIKRHLARAA
jgi:phenylpropionate dioxygenase-like ring-hydroxylating dioxygenase large terminal subunit